MWLMLALGRAVPDEGSPVDRQLKDEDDENQIHICALELEPTLPEHGREKHGLNYLGKPTAESLGKPTAEAV